jgi:hypothetical protein
MTASQKAENCATAKGAAMRRWAMAVWRKSATSDSYSERPSPRITLTCRLTSRCVNPCRNARIGRYSALSCALTSQSRSGLGRQLRSVAERLVEVLFLVALERLAVAQPPGSGRAQVEGRARAAGAEAKGCPVQEVGRCGQQRGERAMPIRVLEVGDELEGDVGCASVVPGVHHKGDGHRGLVHAVSFHRSVYLVDPLCEPVPVQGH